jgi:hypothetical protein
MTAGPVSLLSSRLLPSIGVCFVLLGTSKRLPMRTTGDVLSETLCESIGFSPAGCTSIRITATIGYEKPVVSWQSSRS